MIPQRNLSRLSNRLMQGGGRRIPERVLERDYCLSWFLAGLSRSPLRERLLFKGGTALKKCYYPEYRFSEDLDFTLAEELSFETIRAELEVVFTETYRASGVVFRYAREDRHAHVNSHTFYLGYEGPLPGESSGTELQTCVWSGVCGRWGREGNPRTDRRQAPPRILAFLNVSLRPCWIARPGPDLTSTCRRRLRRLTARGRSAAFPCGPLEPRVRCPNTSPGRRRRSIRGREQ